MKITGHISDINYFIEDKENYDRDTEEKTQERERKRFMEDCK